MDVVLITGANKGIGYEVARQLASKGMHVLLGARDAARGQAAVEALRAEAREFIAKGDGAIDLVVIDVADRASIIARPPKSRKSTAPSMS